MFNRTEHMRKIKQAYWNSLTTEERAQKVRKSSKWNGLSADYPALYMCWANMKDRCTNRKDWGGRGIKVCEEWIEDFPAFVDWALANGWEPGLEIDRKNNNGNYTPRNCRWVTEAVQANNRRLPTAPYEYTKQGKENLDKAIRERAKTQYRNQKTGRFSRK
jgi:hypothetical protein